VWNSAQRKFFVQDVQLRREKQIQDFLVLNEFQSVQFISDTDVFDQFDAMPTVNAGADIVVITDQKFSRYPCPVILDKIQQHLSQCSNLYLCLNRHYINIDNSYHDATLSDNFCLAITQWLRRGLPNANVVDLSLDYLDIGRSFTWAIPDRHYYIHCK
jgi:hypothetical protein